MRCEASMKSICLYDRTATPSHEYQAESVNAKCMDYRNINDTAKISSDLVLSLGFRPLLVSSFFFKKDAYNKISRKYSYGRFHTINI